MSNYHVQCHFLVESCNLKHNGGKIHVKFNVVCEKHYAKRAAAVKMKAGKSLSSVRNCSDAYNSCTAERAESASLADRGIALALS